MSAATESRLTTSAAARRAHVAPDTIRLWVRLGRLPAEQTPLGMLVRMEDLDRFLRERAARHSTQRRHLP